MKKLISILILIVVLSFTACGKKDKADNNSDGGLNFVPVEQSEKAKKEDGEQNKGPVTTAADLESKINRFNQLEDGDPEKEQIREELENLFASVEQ